MSATPAARPGLLRAVLPFAVGLAFVAAALAPEFLPMGGAPGLGRTQMIVFLIGAFAIVSTLLTMGSGGPARADLLLAAGAAALGSAVGMVSAPDYWGAVGIGVLLGALFSPWAAPGRWLADLKTSGNFRPRNLLWFLLAAAQATLAVLIVRQYHLENEALFQSTILIALAGFFFNAFLPRPVRLMFFVFLSMGAFVAILGPLNMLALLVPSAILIGICWLPIPMRARVITLLVFTALLGVLRATPDLATLLPGAVWPLLGSIFMFRLIVYVYDMAHAKNRPTLPSTVAYFFMLPNVVFPFFPVVDYTMFRRGYQDAEDRKIHQDGAIFLFWGVVHLILYRVVNYYLLISPDTVTDLSGLARYLVTNYLLYLRVSGQFHLIIGILHLFGFHLPRTNNRYFLASSFTDLWRRINIYWKDFMLKVFYYPIFFRLKKLGETKALVLATILVFLLTWFFHAWQWFWLRGTFLFTGPDILFWAVLGVLVVVNSLWELRTGRKRSLTQSRLSTGEWASVVGRTAGTFAAMAILWSLWSAQSLTEWGELWSVVPKSLAEAGGLALLSGLLLAGVWFGPLRRATGGTGGATPPDGTPSPAVSKLAAANAGAGGRAASRKPPASPLGPGLLVGAGLLVIYGLGHPALGTRLGDDVARVMRDLRWSRLNDRDQAQLERGYYENLNAVNSFNSQLWELYMRRPVYQEIWETDAVRETGDYLVNELNPDISIVFRGAPYRTNRWGMRDRDYEKLPAPGTFRVALLGDSHTEGWGVGNDENFDHLLESRLNAEPPVTGIERFELLNFAVGGYLPPQMLITLERKVFDFAPQAALLVAHPGDAERAVYHMARGALSQVANPYPELQRFVDEAGVTPDMDLRQAVRALTPHGDAALAVTYNRMARRCREKGITPLWAYVPAVPGRSDPGDHHRMTAMAEEAGFRTIDLSKVFDGYEPDAIRIAEWDQHPNRFGHTLMADRLYEHFRAHPELFQAP